jgi:hypothetical protein
VALGHALEAYRHLGMRAEMAATLERLAALADGGGGETDALRAEASSLWSDVIGAKATTV